jgi:hypothetical protein
MKKAYKGLRTILVVLIVLVPLGIWLPRLFGAGGAWGEWARQEVETIAGYVPRKLHAMSGLWNAPAAGYVIRGTGAYAGYIISAVLGVGIIFGLSYLLGKFLSRQDGKRWRR